MGKKAKQRTKKKTRKIIRDKHLLYSAAVQSVDVDLDFLQRVYRRRHGEKFHRFREDFCGTAAMACDWVARHDRNEAIGVDLDQATLDWGARHYVATLGDAAKRLTLLCRDVLEVDRPRVDVVAAQNFSYSVFKTRELLGRYFRRVRKSLRPGGLFFVDALGGTEAMVAQVEKRRIPASKAWNGVRLPAFTYVWEQVSFNPVDHDFKCNIHFKLSDGTKINRAFHYDWRLWSLPELQELMLEAGFAATEVYLEGWDDEEDDTDGVFRRRKRFDNHEAWVAYVVGLT